VLIAAAAGAIMSACGPDGPDAYSINGAEAVEEVDGATATETETAIGSDGDFEGETVAVIALDNSFRAETIEVAVGTAVNWENRGHNDHNVLPTDESQTWGAPTEAFLPGDHYTWVFDEPGTYPYYCSIHGTKEIGMVGTVVVTDTSD
jgi:plastocyanin